MADQRLAAAHGNIGRELLAEGRLADPRLPHHHQQRPLPGQGAIESSLQLSQLRLATHEDAAVEGVGGTALTRPRCARPASPRGRGVCSLSLWERAGVRAGPLPLSERGGVTARVHCR